MSSYRYVKEAVCTLEDTLKKLELRLPSNVHTPLVTSYRPELDFSLLLDDDHANCYQQLVGILRWSVKLGHVDIHLSITLMAQYLSQPHQVHLQQVFHMFAYLKSHSRSRIILDDTEPYQFIKADWSSFYPDVKEAILSNALEPLGNPILVSCFVDADHAGNRVTR